tara:strand:+ start:1732 stop:2073 length:342 start_codon:yes stop_codon:yes gene_type:complete
MTMQFFGPALLIFLGILVAYSSGFVTYHVSQSDSLEAQQKRAIYLFVWLVPLIGPAITVAALGDDFVRQKRKSGVPLLGYIFLGAALSSTQDQQSETSHAGSSESTGGADGDF